MMTYRDAMHYLMLLALLIVIFFPADCSGWRTDGCRYAIIQPPVPANSALPPAD